MKFGVVTVVALIGATGSCEAFLSRHNNNNNKHRRSSLFAPLQAASDAGDAIKRGFKFLLVPNAKQPPVVPSTNSLPDTPPPLVDAPLPESITGASYTTPPATTTPPSFPFSTPVSSFSFDDIKNSLKPLEEVDWKETVQQSLDWSSGAMSRMPRGDFQWGFSQTGSRWAASWSTFKTSLEDLKHLNQQGSYSLQDYERALNLQETEGWYAAILGFFVVVWLKSLSDQGVSKVGGSYRGRTVDERANLAKVEGEIAKQQAQVADQVAKLAQATKAVTAQLDELQSAKAKRDYDLATMQSEMRTMRNELDVTRKSEGELRASLQKTQDQLDTETASLRLELEQRIKAEDALKKQLTETETRLQSELKAMSEAKDKAESSLAEARNLVNSLKTEKMRMEKDLAFLQSKVSTLQTQLGIKSAPKPVPQPKAPAAKKPAPKMITVAAPKKATLVKKVVAKKVSAKKATAKKKESEPTVPLSSAFFANVTEPVAGSTPASAIKGTTTSTTATLKTVPKSPKPPADAPPKQVLAAKGTVSTSSDDWSSLSPATLKRKTVKDLKDYLSSKGARVTGPGGRALRKDELVEQVLSA